MHPELACPPSETITFTRMGALLNRIACFKAAWAASLALRWEDLVAGLRGHLAGSAASGAWARDWVLAAMALEQVAAAVWEGPEVLASAGWVQAFLAVPVAGGWELAVLAWAESEPAVLVGAG